MTRKTHQETIADEQFAIYDDSLTIADPGRFEGEPRYLPHFWIAFLDGVADEHHDGSCSVVVEYVDKVRFPELKRRKRVRMRQRDDGFIVEI